MEGLRVQVFFFLLYLCLALLATTARSSEPDASRQDELEMLRSKIDILESTIVEKNRELKSKTGIIIHMDKVIQEKSAGINSLQRKLEAIQNKDSLNKVDLLEKANIQVAKLEKQIHELLDEIQLEKQKQEDLGARASKAEKETNEISVKLETLHRTSEHQNKMFKQAERSFKIAKDELSKAQSEADLKKKELAEIHAAWFPPWITIHVKSYLDTAASHWNRHAKPALDIISKEASKFSCWAKKRIEPHWHLVNYEVQKFSKPYMGLVTTITKPHVEKVRALIEPYTNKTVRAYMDFLEASGSYHQKVQSFTREKLKKYELTDGLATKELAWFLASSALLALPVYLFYKLLKALFWKKPRRSSNKSQGQAHRKHRRRHE